MNDYLAATKQYFSKWLNVEPSLFDCKGIFSAYSQDRDRRLQGHGRRFPLFCFVTDDLAILSHNEALKERVENLKEVLPDAVSVEYLKREIEREFHAKPGHSRKYYFTQVRDDLDTSSVKQLNGTDYADFLKFYETQYPKVDHSNWLKDYFLKIANQGYVFAVYEDCRIVSATDAPDVPYMADLIVEPGIATLAPFRRRGHAKLVVATLLKHLVASHKVPIWSCTSDNIGSSKLAESVGYQLFGEALFLSNQ